MNERLRLESIKGREEEWRDGPKALRVPGDSEADLQQVIATDAAEQALDVRGSALQTIDELKSLLADLRTAITASTSAALRLRTDLGIPAGPTKATPT